VLTPQEQRQITERGRRRLRLQLAKIEAERGPEDHDLGNGEVDYPQLKTGLPNSIRAQTKVGYSKHTGRTSLQPAARKRRAKK
jgi:hypothetical protein